MSVEIHKDTPLSHTKLTNQPLPYHDFVVFDSLLHLKVGISSLRLPNEVFFWARRDPANLIALHASALCVERLATSRLFCRSRLVGTKGHQADIRSRRFSESNASSNGCHLYTMQKIALKTLCANTHMLSIHESNLSR